MPAIAFRVQSDRISDIEVPSGSTVADLRSSLFAKCYDVRDARVRVRRRREKDVLVGKVDSYRLGAGDAVEFCTESMHLPVAERLEKERKAACACGSQCCSGQDKREGHNRVIIMVLSPVKD